MGILIDPPRWPAHGTVFAHLISDTSLEELHAFAREAELPPRAFDHDHYDVPASRYDDLVALGAHPVGEMELIRALTASGLRVRKPQKSPTREQALDVAHRSWRGLGLPNSLRDDLLTRWQEPHRHYHDVRHLAQVLTALEELQCSDPVVVLAAWFHDAVYEGVAGEDEEASARLAEESLSRLSGQPPPSPTLVHPPPGPAPAVSNWIGSRPRHAVETGETSHDPIQLLTDDGASTDDGALTGREIADVGRLIRMTTTHSPSEPREALLSDADLSILGQIPGRYHVYVRDVRLDYAHLEDRAWRRGRAQVLEHLLAKEPLFHTELGRDLWETAARRNLAAELRSLAEPR